MPGHRTVWVDVERCSGCGDCVEACPLEAISMVDGKACVDEETCDGCLACVDACPEGVIEAVVQGEIVMVEERPAPVVRRSEPLAEGAAVAVAVAGAGLLVRVAQFLIEVVGQWLARRSAAPEEPLRTGAQPSSSASADGPAGAGRRGRHRRRGG